MEAPDGACRLPGLSACPGRQPCPDIPSSRAAQLPQHRLPPLPPLPPPPPPPPHSLAATPSPAGLVALHSLLESARAAATAGDFASCRPAYARVEAALGKAAAAASAADPALAQQWAAFAAALREEQELVAACEAECADLATWADVQPQQVCGRLPGLDCGAQLANRAYAPADAPLNAPPSRNRPPPRPCTAELRRLRLLPPFPWTCAHLGRRSCRPARGSSPHPRPCQRPTTPTSGRRPPSRRPPAASAPRRRCRRATARPRPAGARPTGGSAWRRTSGTGARA